MMPGCWMLPIMLALTGAATPPANPVLAAAQAARGEQLALLETLVNIDSGTGERSGGQRVSERIADELRQTGLTVSLVPAERPHLPDNVVATLTGTGRGRILMIGHSDTVFETGTAARRPFRMDSARAYGPGVLDEKGGVVHGIFALRLLQTLAVRDFAKITFLIETSEETGSPGTLALIDRLLADADVELNLEGAGDGSVVVMRKGSADIFVSVKGRAAHAGSASQNGRNAALELVHQIEQARGLPTSGPGMTVNLTLLEAGTRDNIIPSDAKATYNMRAVEPGQFAEVLARFRRNAKTTVIPDTIVTVTQAIDFPPLPENPASHALFLRAKRVLGRIGLPLDETAGGGSSTAALAYAAGVPTLDALGAVGGSPHGEDEFIELAALTPRLYLLTNLLIELGRELPTRLR